MLRNIASVKPKAMKPAQTESPMAAATLVSRGICVLNLMANITAGTQYINKKASKPMRP